MGCCGDKVPGEVLVTLDLDWAISHTKKSLNRILETPNFEAQKQLLGSILTFSRLDVHILQILKYVDMPGMSTNFIVSFHNYVPTLVH